MTIILDAGTGRSHVEAGRSNAPCSVVVDNSERFGDPAPERIGNLVLAAAGDNDAKLGLEVERLEARAAVLEMLVDRGALLVGEFAVEELVELVK
jgi:hypothetical protein